MTPSDFPFGSVLYAPRGISRESGIDAGNRPHVHGMAFHGSPADEELLTPERILSRQETRQTPDASDASDAHIPASQDDRATSGAQEISLPSAEKGNMHPESGMVH